MEMPDYCFETTTPTGCVPPLSVISPAPVTRLTGIGHLSSVILSGGIQANLFEQGGPLGTQAGIPRVLLYGTG